jgi:hypothetical protein
LDAPQISTQLNIGPVVDGKKRLVTNLLRPVCKGSIPDLGLLLGAKRIRPAKIRYRVSKARFKAPAKTAAQKSSAAAGP